MKTQTFILPSHWAPYLINGVATSFSLNGGDAEITDINDWVLENSLGFCIDCGEESWFSWRNDGPNPFIGNTVCEFTFELIETFEVVETNHA